MGLDDDEGQKLFLVQMPSVLPISTRTVKELAARSAAADPAAGAAAPAGAAAAASTSAVDARRGTSLKELPSGLIGRLLVYRSGKVKLQMGEVLMDVSPGLPCLHRIDVSWRYGL